ANDAGDLGKTRMSDRLASRNVVLIGIGHTNAHVLRMWGMNPIPDTSLTCVSNFSAATYSGMLPAVLAGQITQEEMEIDLVRLCASVGANLIRDEVCEIDHDNREVLFRRRPSVPYDALSIGIGSVPCLSGLEAGSQDVLTIKPMQTFLQRLAAAIEQASENKDSSSPLRVLVVGGGVAGVEISLCLSPFVRAWTTKDHSIELVTRSESILPEVLPSTRGRIVRQFDQRGIKVFTRRSARRFESGKVTLDDDSTIEADIVIWATGAVAPPAMERFGLPLDDRGFIATDDCLKSVAGHPIFAVGDTGSMVDHALPKAGVYAVRQGPALWSNIQRLLAGQPLHRYVPQPSFLKLINHGDGNATGQWKRFSFSGAWVMRLKQKIDVEFMDKYRPAGMMDGADEPMQCRGCGSKLGSGLLQSALANSGGGIKVEDAAEIGGDAGRPLVASTDFFSSPFQDAYLAGRVCALHSASDIIATGANPTEALANVVLPAGDAAAQQKTLQDFLYGAREEFEAMGAAVVGGHTIVGPRMETGFTVIGRPAGDHLIRKENLTAGHQLMLTKPIGIGVLLAAHMRGMCAASDYETLLETMLSRQHAWVGLSRDFDLCAGTDVTGFGLAGHLLEMIDASGVSATIRLDDVPLLPGVSSLLDQGIERSLAPENRWVENRLRCPPELRSRPAYRTLFDPQTCGGLLLAVPAESVRPLQDAAAAAGLAVPLRIGEVSKERLETNQSLIIE
ncbi:MAG: selenide, water dikinase SelD, partial [Pirellulales bacterium]|nr:selenide, water dikinase SelD [Pirellulales bacterium]